MIASHRSRSRGFTIILGVVLLGLIAVALALLTKQLGYELQRTRSAYEDAQLRQLLLAGAQDAAARAGRWSAQGPAAPGAWKVELPADLNAQDASISIEAMEAGPDGRTVRIEARLSYRRAEETLEFSRTDAGWKFVRIRGEG